VESYPYPVKEGQRYINLNTGRLLFSSHPKRERDRKAHCNYYASSAYNRGDNYHTARQNLTKYDKNKHVSKIHITQNQHIKTKARISRLLRHPAWKRSGAILVECKEMEKQENGRSE